MIFAKRFRFSSGGVERVSRWAGAAASSRSSQLSMPVSIRSAKSASRVSGCVPCSVWPEAAMHSRVRAKKTLRDGPAGRIAQATDCEASEVILEDHFQRKLNCAGRTRLAVGAEVRIDLPALSVEAGA